MNVSEIAYIRQKIEDECIAMHNLMYAPTRVATHEIISNKYKSLDRLSAQIETITGSREIAVSMVIDIYDATFDRR